MAEETIDGKVTSNFDICNDTVFKNDHIQTLHNTVKEDALEQAFLDIYLSLNRVIHSYKKHANNKPKLFFTD